VKPDWIRRMGRSPLSSPARTPCRDLPYAAKEAGAHIIATGRGDFPNQ